MPRVTADGDELLKQASMTADEYFSKACVRIDKQFGNGYAEKHPELIAAFMQTAARDLHTSMTASALQDIAEAIQNQ